MLEIVERDKNQAEVNQIVNNQSFALYSAEEESVRKIIAEVAERGDAALVEYTQKYDLPAGRQGWPRFSQKDLVVAQQEIDDAYLKVDAAFKNALSKAAQNITAFHQKQKPDEWFETLPLDVLLGQRLIPLGKVGVYVPGGRAIYPSSVLMGAIPAKVAGVKEIIVVTPPPIDPHVLVAAAEVGISKIFRVGGAQAIAALAFGTETVPKVDKIVGPGNRYVTLAKKQVFGIVGIDSLAGPSNVVIIADQDAEPEFMAADLLSQVEHDPSSFAVMFTDSPAVAENTFQEIKKQSVKLARKEIIESATIKIFVTENIQQAVELSNQIAPEHLEMQIGSPQRFLEKIRNAGAVFLGPYSPVPVGDYIAGPSHVLPTGGTARFLSPLGVYDFVKTQSIIGYTKPALKNVWKDIKLLAEIESLDAHARAIDVRFS